MKVVFMKTKYWVAIVLALGVLGVAGCKKSAATNTGLQPIEVQGVKVDLPKLSDAYNNASPEAQAAVADLKSNIRYGMYVKALAGLDKLVNDPSSTDQQKQIVNQVIEQLKQLIQKAPAPGQ